MSELKPCPFCGSEVQDDVRGEKYPKKLPIGLWIVRCECCGASMSQFRKSGKDEISWNTRPIEDALNARIAELELRLDVYNGNLYDVVVDELDKANARIAELEAARRWIPVGERLPEEKQNVLALDKTGTAYHWEYSRSLANIFVGYYTHWMPLPKLPEVKHA